MIRISNVARALGRTITTTSSKLALVAALAIVTITSALAQSSTRDSLPFAYESGHKGNPTSAHQNGYLARSHPCDYRDFHVWDQTYHCNV